MANLGTNNNAAGSSKSFKQKESDSYNARVAAQRTASRLLAKHNNLSEGATQRTQSRLVATNINSSPAATYRTIDKQWQKNNNRIIPTPTKPDYEHLRNSNFEMPDTNENAAKKKKESEDVKSELPSPPPGNDAITETKTSSFENLRYANHNRPQERTVGFHYKPKLEAVLVRKKKRLPAVTGLFQEIKAASKWKAQTRKSIESREQNKPEAKVTFPPPTKKNPKKMPLFPKATLAKGHENDWTKITSTESDNYKFKQSGTGLKQQVWENFDYSAMGPSTLTAWISPGEKPVTPPPLEVLRRQHPIPDHVNEKLIRHGVREENALDNFEKSQMERLHVENYILDKIDRPRGQMMLRRNQNIPKSEVGGKEKDMWMEERAQTPDKFPDWAFFVLPIDLKGHEGLQCQMTKKQRGYDMILDPTGRPAVTDAELKRLEMMEGPPEEIEEGSSMVTSESEMPDEDHLNDNCPVMQDLGVVGSDYRRAQQEIKGEYIFVEKEGHRATLKSNSSSISPRSKKSQHNVGKQLKSLKSIKGLSVNSIDDFEEYDMSYVGLKFGDALLSWSNETDRASRKWIIEVGCSAEVGEKSLSHVFLENTGTSVIRYSWVKVTRKDPLQTNRYHRDRFIFDDWGGNILPGEIYRAPILYKSTETGYFSQDWRLMTQPVLECGAVVILRMWGVSRQYDPYFLAKDKVDEAIRARIPWNIVSHRVEKIFDYLPLREDSYKDIRFPLITLGSELFLFHNPFLWYHSASVFRLGKLFDIMQLRKSKSKTMTRDISRMDSEHSDESTPDIPEEEEEEDYEEEDILSLPESDSSHDGLYDTLVDFSKVQTLDTKSIIQYAADAIREMIDPDMPHLKDVEAIYNAQYVTDEGNGVEVSPRKGLPVAPINLVNPDFMIEKLRTDILSDHGITEIKEALFDVYSKEVDFLFFKPNLAREDWKTTIGRCLLSECIDKFSEYAGGLQDICFEAEYRQHELIRLEEIERTRNLDDASSVMSPDTSIEKKSDGSNEAKEPHTASNKRKTSAVNKSGNAADSRTSIRDEQKKSFEQGRPSRLDVADPIPEDNESDRASVLMNLKDSISPQRYKDQYYTRLHMRMYQLLCEVFDNMDKLFSTEKQPPIRLDYKEVAFKKIRNVQMPVNIDSLLLAPLPPKWVAMAEKLKDAKDRRRRRASELDCPWLPGYRKPSEARKNSDRGPRNRSNSNILLRGDNILKYESRLEYTTEARAHNQSNSNSGTAGVRTESTDCTRANDGSFIGPWTEALRLKNINDKRADGRIIIHSETATSTGITLADEPNDII